MRKKQEKGGYALASSSISDIPVPLTSGQGEYYISAQSRDLKQSSSLYMPYNQQLSRGEESVNLNFSTARPFYDEIAEEYYSGNQARQKQEYNIKTGRTAFEDKSAFRKSPNKRIMVYSYSNVFSLNKIIETLIKKIKKRTLKALSLASGSPHLLEQDSIHQQRRRQLESERAFLAHGRRRAVTIIEGWLCYQLLREKRRVMNLIISCSEHRRSSLSLSQSLRASQGAEENQFLTGFRSNNEISISQGLPQQIEESLVYALQNQEPSRKETTESTLEKYPTERQEHPTQKKRELHASGSSVRSSPVYQLKALVNSPFAQDTISIAQPLPLFKQKAPSALKRESPLPEPKNKASEHCSKQEQGLLPDVLESRRKEEEQYLQLGEGAWEQVKKRRFQESARYSQVSNYHLENSKNRQETYYIKTNFAIRPPFEEDRTVVKSHAAPFLSTRVIRNEKIADSLQQVSSNTVQRFGYQANGSLHDIQQMRHIQQPIHQLQNDRIRIFEPPRAFPSRAVVKSGNNYQINSNMPGKIAIFQEASKVRNQSPSPSSHRSMEPRAINGRKRIFITNEHASPPNSQLSHQHNANPSVPLNQRMRTQASPVVFFQPPNIQRQPLQRQNKNEGKVFTHSPNLVNRANSPQPQLQGSFSPFSKHFSQTPLFHHPQQATLQRISSPQGRAPIRAGEQQHHRWQLQPKILHQRHQLLQQPNQYELQMREKRQLRIPQRRGAFQVQALGSHDERICALASRAKSSASSPKLVFNYGARGEGQEARVSDNLTKNSSQISRPKSTNSKLHITLKHKN